MSQPNRLAFQSDFSSGSNARPSPARIEQGQAHRKAPSATFLRDDEKGRVMSHRIHSPQRPPAVFETANLDDTDNGFTLPLGIAIAGLGIILLGSALSDRI